MIYSATSTRPKELLCTVDSITCADLYEHFLFSLGDSCYYPSGAPHVSDNRLIAMYHANTPSHNKDVIFHSMQKPDGVVRVVFATVALGMGINFAALNTTMHYGAPSTIEDYFQESGCVGRSGEQGISIVFLEAIRCT